MLLVTPADPSPFSLHPVRIRQEVFLSITAAAERDQPTDLTAQAAAAAADRHAPFPGAAFPSPSSGLPSPSKTPTPPPLPAQPPHLTASPSSPSPSSPPSPPSGTGATAAVPVQPLRGWRLYGSQLRALLTKRALCARRDRLAVVTQLAVPLALVYLALWISALQVRSKGQVISITWDGLHVTRVVVRSIGDVGRSWQAPWGCTWDGECEKVATLRYNTEVC